MYTSTKSISKIGIISALIFITAFTPKTQTIQITFQEESLKTLARSALKLASGISGLILMTTSTLQLKEQQTKNEKKRIPLKRSLAYYCLGMGVGLPLFIAAIITLKQAKNTEIPSNWWNSLTRYVPEI